MRSFVQCSPALPPTSPLWDHCPPTPRQESIICWCHCWVEGGGLWVTLLCPHPPLHTQSTRAAVALPIHSLRPTNRTSFRGAENIEVRADGEQQAFASLACPATKARCSL